MSDAPAQDLWEFSLEVYAKEGVAPACLALQDRRGANVNVLLASCWFASLGAAGLRAADFGRMNSAIEGWHAGVIEPLRRIRQRLKDGVPPAPAEPARALRARVLEVELEAERIEQGILVAHLPAPGPAVPDPGRPRVAAANLACYVRVRGVAVEDADRERLVTLLCASFPALGRDEGQGLMRAETGVSD